MSAGNQAKNSAWEETTLGHLGRLHCGQSPPSPTVNTSGRGIPYVSGPEQWDGVQIHQTKWTTAPARHAPENSIFITVKGAGVGTIFPGIHAAIGRDIYAFEPHPRIDIRFLYHAIQYSVHDVVAKAHGDIPGLSKDHILNHRISVSGPKTQRSVATKIDELFSRIEEGLRALELGQRQVERYRESVLKAAVTGELTREWRERRKVQLEPGETLLARILKARREAWEESELSKMKARGQKPSNDLWKQRYKVPVAPNAKHLPELPDGWIWGSVEQLSQETLIGLDRGAAQQFQGGDGTDYIKMNNITIDGRLLLKDIVKVEASIDERAKFSLRPGDILFNTRNSRELVGKVAIVPPLRDETVYNNNLMRIRTVRHMDPAFLTASMCEYGFRSRLERIKKATTSVAAVYAKDLFPLAVAVPPPDEQLAIMSEVNRRLQVLEHVRGELEMQIRSSQALKQAILHSAFSGELVRHENADEPASVLLERIAAECAKVEKRPVIRRRRKVTA